MNFSGAVVEGMILLGKVHIVLDVGYSVDSDVFLKQIEGLKGKQVKASFVEDRR